MDVQVMIADDLVVDLVDVCGRLQWIGLLFRYSRQFWLVVSSLLPASAHSSSSLPPFLPRSLHG